MPRQKPNSLYPEVIQSNPESVPNYNSKDSKPSSSSSLYPTVVVEELVENLFPHPDEPLHNPNYQPPPTAPLESVEEILIKIPGAIAHLIDKQYSVELASGDLLILRLRQGNQVVAVLARIGDEIQWPLGKDEAAVRVDESHYFFSLRVPPEDGSDSSDDEDHKGNESDNILNYGVTIASKGQEHLLKELDKILESYISFSVQKVSKKSEVLDGWMAKETSPAELNSEKKKEMEKMAAAYWTTLAPNVEDYSGCVARVIAAGSGQVIKGILWCGDVTVERLKWGNEFLIKRMAPCSEQSEVSPEALKRIKRVKKITKMSEKVATGILSGVLKVSGYFTSSVVNSKVGKKFFNMLPGEVVLASLDGLGRVCDAVEVAGKNVMSTSSVVTTGLVSHRYGEKAAEATNEGLGAAGHAAGAAWAVLKIRKALNPKSAVKPTTLGKSAIKAAAAEMKSKYSK
ncbi:Senescence/spartin-associated [Macleaya cordata]|uniref:Senescence/spartin-associated n=1 Tax=Macleaya cordata TaxID=56857 RepID=A0A200RAC3_MACCD|nr:Senescence/spartin-associated [Macleaya cordata]